MIQSHIQLHKVIEVLRPLEEDPRYKELAETDRHFKQYREDVCELLRRIRAGASYEYAHEELKRLWRESHGKSLAPFQALINTAIEALRSQPV